MVISVNFVIAAGYALQRSFSVWGVCGCVGSQPPDKASKGTGHIQNSPLFYRVRFTFPRLMSRRNSSTPPTPKAVKITAPAATYYFVLLSKIIVTNVCFFIFVFTR